MVSRPKNDKKMLKMNLEIANKSKNFLISEVTVKFFHYLNILIKLFKNAVSGQNLFNLHESKVALAKVDAFKPWCKADMKLHMKANGGNKYRIILNSVLAWEIW